MFNDAQEIQHNVQACEYSRNEGLDIQEYESEYEQERVDWNLEHRVNNIIASLEVFNAHNFAKDYIPLVERGGASLTPYPFWDKQRVDCFMYSFVNNQEDEVANQPVEE